MKRVIPLILISGMMVGGCAIYPDDYYDPYAPRYELGYYYGYGTGHYLPMSYFHRCNGIYAPSGACVYYRVPYSPVTPAAPADENVIPVTQPPVMALDDDLYEWRGTVPVSVFNPPATDVPVATNWREVRQRMQAESRRTAYPARSRASSQPARTQRYDAGAGASSQRSSPPRTARPSRAAPRATASRSAPRSTDAPSSDKN